MKKQLPKSVQTFVGSLQTVPVSSVWSDGPAEPEYPYAQYWYRAVAAILLAGRVAAKTDGSPNRTDVNRVCKEANFNQHYFDDIARFLLAAAVIEPNDQGSYRKGKAHHAFWQGEVESLQDITRSAFLTFVGDYTGYQPWRPTLAYSSGLAELSAIFFHSLNGLAVREDQIGEAFLTFSRLPENDLTAAMGILGIEEEGALGRNWEPWFDKKGQAAMLQALFATGWAFCIEHGKRPWVFLNDTGRAMLGLASPPSKAPPILDFRALPNRTILAGADRPIDSLVPLFRFLKISRIDRLFEFEVNRQRLKEAPSRGPGLDELRAVLGDLAPLPDAIDRLLGTTPSTGGHVSMRLCSALITARDPDVLTAIQEHRWLKGYIESGCPPGYLLIKSTSSAHNFVKRCLELGFEVEVL